MYSQILINLWSYCQEISYACIAIDLNHFQWKSYMYHYIAHQSEAVYGLLKEFKIFTKFDKYGLHRKEKTIQYLNDS